MGYIADSISQTDIFSNFILPLIQGGYYQYLFPFLLVYAVVLTILNKVKIFSENKSVRIIISLIFALFSITFPVTDNCASNSFYYSYGNSCTLGDIMIILFPGVTAFTIGILALYIVAAMLGVDLIEILGRDKKNKDIMKYILGALGLIVVGYYYAKAFGWVGLNSSFWLWRLLSDPTLYIVIIIGLLFFWVSSDGGNNNSHEEGQGHNHENDHGGGH